MDRCYACSQELRPEWEDAPAHHEQWENALVVELSGGYGMFTDVLTGDPGQVEDRGRGILAGQGSLRVVICHGCAHGMCEALPWLDRLIAPASSHSHRLGSVPDDHVGWDLPHHCPVCDARTTWSAWDPATPEARQRHVCSSDPDHDLGRGLTTIDGTPL